MATDRRDPFTASMPAAATATATGGTLVGACGTLLTHLWWVKRDGTIQRVWLLSMTRPSLIPFSYRFFLFPPRCPLLVMYLGGWTGTVWTTCHTPHVHGRCNVRAWGLERISSTGACTNTFAFSPKMEVRYSFWIADSMALLAKSLVILLGDRTSGRDGETPNVPLTLPWTRNCDCFWASRRASCRAVFGVVDPNELLMAGLVCLPFPFPTEPRLQT